MGFSQVVVLAKKSYVGKVWYQSQKLGSHHGGLLPVLLPPPSINSCPILEFEVTKSICRA
jgi:hypothetical protein